MTRGREARRGAASTRSITAFGCLLAACLLFGDPASAKEVAVVLDSHVRPFVEAMAGFQAVSKGTTRVYERNEDNDPTDELALIDTIRSRSPDHIVVFGEEALETIATKITDIPILFCMVFNPMEKVSSESRNLTGVSMNVPPEKQMALLARLAPTVKTVGVVYNPSEVEHLVEAGHLATSKYRMQLDASPVTSTIEAVQAAKNMMGTIDAFWMLPDRTVTTIELVKYLLFNARKQEIPLIGVSDKYVKAGALFAYTARNESLGRQAAEMSNLLLNGSAPADLPPQMARDLELSINSKVAAALGLTISDRLLREAAHVY